MAPRVYFRIVGRDPEEHINEEPTRYRWLQLHQGGAIARKNRRHKAPVALEVQTLPPSSIKERSSFPLSAFISRSMIGPAATVAQPHEAPQIYCLSPLGQQIYNTGRIIKTRRLLHGRSGNYQPTLFTKQAGRSASIRCC